MKIFLFGGSMDTNFWENNIYRHFFETKSTEENFWNIWSEIKKF